LLGGEAKVVDETPLQPKLSPPLEIVALRMTEFCAQATEGVFSCATVLLTAATKTSLPAPASPSAALSASRMIDAVLLRCG